MNRFLLFFLRLLAMAFGFFVACLVTGAALASFTRFMTPDDIRTLGDETFTGVLIYVLAVTGITAYAAMVPAMFLCVFAEMRSKRDWLFYCLGGGMIAALTLSFVVLNPQQDSRPSIEFLAIAIVSGMLGGIAYWAVAGRHAGGWLPRQIKRRRLERSDKTADE